MSSFLISRNGSRSIGGNLIILGLVLDVAPGFLLALTVVLGNSVIQIGHANDRFPVEFRAVELWVTEASTGKCSPGPATGDVREMPAND